MYQALGFDLDNTLYDQSQHLRSFFEEAGLWIAQRSKVAAKTAEQSFLQSWERHTMACPFVFDEALQNLGLLRPDWIRELVSKYRSHRCPLTPYEGVGKLLEQLARRYPLFLVTNGYGQLQRFKLQCLGLGRFFRATIFTADYGPGWEKPAPCTFTRAALLVRAREEHCLFVGDDPECDIGGARRAGMATARVLTGPFRNRPCQPPPNLVLEQVIDLELVLGGARAAAVTA